MGFSPDEPPPIPVARRVFHVVACSFTTLLALAMPEHPYMLVIGGGALLGLALDTGRPRINRLNRLYLGILKPILKQSESTEITGATWFLLAAFFAFYFYGPSVAIPVLMFVAVGDPAAALVGARIPGPRIWGKSPAGSVAFIGFSLAAWAIIAALGFRRLVLGGRYRGSGSGGSGAGAAAGGRQPVRAAGRRRADDPDQPMAGVGATLVVALPSSSLP